MINVKTKFLFVLGILAVLVVSGCTQLFDKCEREYQSCVDQCDDLRMDISHDLCVAGCASQKERCKRS